MKKIYSFSALEVFNILLEVLHENCLINDSQLADEDNEINISKDKYTGDYELQVVLKDLD